MNMDFIPKGTRWYLADVVLEHRIEDDPRTVSDSSDGFAGVG